MLVFVSTEDKNRVDITAFWLSHAITTLDVLLATEGNLTSSIKCLQREKKNTNHDSSVSSNMRIVEVKMATTVGRVYVELSFLQNEIQCYHCINDTVEMTIL